MFVHATEANRSHAADPNVPAGTFVTVTHSVVPAVGTYTWNPLLAEVAGLQSALDRPAARLLARNGEQPLRLDEVEVLLASPMLVLDACRRGLRVGGVWRSMTRRPDSGWSGFSVDGRRLTV